MNAFETIIGQTVPPEFVTWKPRNDGLDMEIHDAYHSGDYPQTCKLCSAEFQSPGDTQSYSPSQDNIVQCEDDDDMDIFFESIVEYLHEIDPSPANRIVLDNNFEDINEPSFEDINDEDLMIVDLNTSSQAIESQEEGLEQLREESLESIFSDIIDENYICLEGHRPCEETEVESSFDEDWMASDEVEAELIELSDSAKHDVHSDMKAKEPDSVIVRPPFPQLVKGESPIDGLSTDTVVQTCFRTGEALNAGAKAYKLKQHAILEIYAYVVNSYREDGTNKQYFTLGDLFNDNAPRLDGVYELWKGVDLWAYDSGALIVKDGRKPMCRCMARVKRNDNQWRLIILNIWEATWDDVEHVRGIICA